MSTTTFLFPRFYHTARHCEQELSDSSQRCNTTVELASSPTLVSTSVLGILASRSTSRRALGKGLMLN